MANVYWEKYSTTLFVNAGQLNDWSACKGVEIYEGQFAAFFLIWMCLVVAIRNVY
jgi:hypothetical protein